MQQNECWAALKFSQPINYFLSFKCSFPQSLVVWTKCRQVLCHNVTCMAPSLIPVEFHIPIRNLMSTVYFPHPYRQSGLLSYHENCTLTSTYSMLGFLKPTSPKFSNSSHRSAQTLCLLYS
jgi:hypothetical protein